MMTGKVMFALLLLVALSYATHKRPHKCHGNHCRDQDDDASDAQQRIRRGVHVIPDSPVRVLRAASNGGQKPPKIEIQPATPGTSPPGSPVPIPKGSGRSASSKKPTGK